MHGLTKKFSDLFAEAFLANSDLEQAEVTAQDRLALAELLPVEVYEHLKELIHDLLQFKRRALSSEKFQLLRQNQQLKAHVQRLQHTEQIQTEPRHANQNPLFRTTLRPKKTSMRKTPAEQQLRTADRKTLVKKFARPLLKSTSVKRCRKQATVTRLS